MKILTVNGGFNIRDLGGYETPCGPTAYGAFLRSACLNRVTPEGKRALVKAGLRLVVDLRRVTEVAEGQHPFAADPDVSYTHIPLYDALDPTRMVADGGSDSLLRLYRNALSTRQEKIAAIFLAFTATREGAVLFHCTAGKDRTGIVAALLLSLAGVSPEDIARDYAATAALIAPQHSEILRHALNMGFNKEKLTPLLASREETMLAFLEELNVRYGGSANYLLRIGLTEKHLTVLQEKIMGKQAL